MGKSTLCPEVEHYSQGNLLDCFANARNDDIDTVIASQKECVACPLAGGTNQSPVIIDVISFLQSKIANHIIYSAKSRSFSRE